MTSSDRALEDYLRKLGWGLAALDGRERDEIVAETRAHVLEKIERGASAEDVLAEFGPPERYARAFLDERELAGALSSQRSGDLLGAVMRRVTRSAVALVAFVVIVVVSLAAFAALVLVYEKIVDPVHAGLWWSDREQFIGVIDDPSEARELLGNWVFLAAAAIIAAAWLIGRFVLTYAVRALARAGR